MTGASPHSTWVAWIARGCHDRTRMPSPAPLPDAEGRLRWVNAAWERSTGWSAEELYSRPYLEFVHPDDRAKVTAFAERLTRIPPGESLQVECRACHRD